MNERTRQKRRNLTEAVEEYRRAVAHPGGGLIPDVNRRKVLQEIAADRGLTQKSIREAYAVSKRPLFPPQ